MLKNEVQRWKCTNKNCKSFLKLDDLKNMISEPTSHNHDSNEPAHLKRQQLSNGLKRKAITDISIKPSKLICTELSGGCITSTAGDINLVRKNIYNARRTILPKIPTNSEEVHNMLQQNQIFTAEKENFVMVNDKQTNIILFSCEKNLRFLSNLKTIYVDGTFQYCPKFFLQMFTIHGLINDYYIPLAFFLLPNKESKTYEKAFTYLNESCSKYNATFAPDTVFVDFEIAIHKAVCTVWTEAEIKGCRFHLGQSWWRKIQNLGLANEYKNKSEIGLFLRICFGLPFLPPEMSNRS
ncbi:uncharacterized protein LOC126550995 [Aphis gossypii]|uniref:uncharacterized protein LOC126550995 n=1 Tax=Aphis gossypii TaxID=80765 RepID=UPI002158CFF5|nr:uncharacterized protein LOC126550995 [Aphis gossypii]